MIILLKLIGTMDGIVHLTTFVPVAVNVPVVDPLSG
jgi:hypothetical protein